MTILDEGSQNGHGLGGLAAPNLLDKGPKIASVLMLEGGGVNLYILVEGEGGVKRRYKVGRRSGSPPTEATI